ncbi:MAG: CHC2 zinc finger domain-containing protein, partial [Faecalibacterium sp.]
MPFEPVSNCQVRHHRSAGGEMYGMEPDRHDMVCCPFHSDNHPSMKLNDTYYYCFGCGASGDAIDTHR